MAVMACAAVLGAFGQYAMKRGSVLGFREAVPWLAVVALLYGAGILINIVVYRLGAKVSVVYPVIALSYVVSAVLAWKLLREPMNAWIVAGSCIIVLGVACIGFGSAR
jgi:drug/metabolite transporter (DMT)-like permease